MHICIFEDQAYRKLLPLVYLRPVYDLKCGIHVLKDKIIRTLDNPAVTLHVRDYLSKMLARDYPNYRINQIPDETEEVLFINGRILVDTDFKNQITSYEGDCVFVNEGTVVAAKLTGENLDHLKKKLGKRIISISDFTGIRQETIDSQMINYPWDLFLNNGEQIEIDFYYITKGNPQLLGDLSEGVHLINQTQIHISEGAKIKPGVVLDADSGPIYIGKNTKVLPNAVIEGPAYIGDNSLIKVGAKIYENTSIGDVCKVGGEVEESIIHGYSNKQHEGFLGHAYLGTWVNIGADTNNSDLKNNYGSVKVYIDGELIDSGSMFVGLIMGDHSKSGINVMFNTGTVVGICCNVFGSNLPPKLIPSFSWGSTDDGFVTYKLDKAFEVATRVMERRKIPFADIEAKIFRQIFNLTEYERVKTGISG